MFKSHWFQFVYGAVFILFMAIMSYVTYLAYTRPSHATKIDIAKIQKLRYDALVKPDTETLSALERGTPSLAHPGKGLPPFANP